jgi:hypothetical protein
MLSGHRHGRASTLATVRIPTPLRADLLWSNSSTAEPRGGGGGEGGLLEREEHRTSPKSHTRKSQVVVASIKRLEGFKSR